MLLVDVQEFMRAAALCQARTNIHIIISTFHFDIFVSAYFNVHVKCNI